MQPTLPLLWRRWVPLQQGACLLASRSLHSSCSQASAAAAAAATDAAGSEAAVEGSGPAGAESCCPVLRVEYCVLCNYKPRFDLLKRSVQQAFPWLPVLEDTQDHRPGAFEVVLQQGKQATDLWSKLITGEPADLQATEGVAELVVRDLQRLLPQVLQQ